MVRYNALITVASAQPRHPRYEIRRTIGSGGMGVVYEAYDRERKALIALKTMRATGSASQFKNEFRALADVVHPNLVGLYELVADHDQLFFTMELIDGVPLLDWVWKPAAHSPPESPGVAGRGPIGPGSSLTHTLGLDPEERSDSSSASGVTHSLASGPMAATRAPRVVEQPAVDLVRLRDAARQLALGISAIHEAGKLHRDLKPSNTLVTAAGRLVILDFGLVETVSEGAWDDGHLTRDRPLAGTAPYMSPEQCARLKAGPPSDWYGLGAMLYVTLTGRPPFLGPAAQVVADKQRFEPPPPGQVATGVPEDLEALVVDLLRRDPRARPPTAEILRRLDATRQDRPHPADSTAVPSLLVGRSRELGQLTDALEAVRAGQRRLVRVHGSSGTGKSVLVHHFLDGIDDPNCLILSGRCYERESLPYKALDSIMEQIARVMAHADANTLRTLTTRDATLAARIFPALHRLEPGSEALTTAVGPVSFELRRRAFTAVRRLFGGLARDRTVILFIDDLQWGDADSGPLLDEIVGSPRSPSLLVIVAYRSKGQDTNPLVAHIAEQPGTEIELGPLPLEEAQTLAEQLLRAAGLPANRAAAIAQEAGGHPFFAHELVRLAGTGEAEVEGSVTLDRLIELRVRRLPREARAFLETAAVAGRPTAISTISIASGVAGADLAKTVNLLRARQLVRTTGARHSDLVEPYHDRVTEALAGMIEESEARALHLAVAHALLDAGSADAEALARHFLGAGVHARAVDYSLEAAAKAERTMAFARAAKLYEQALEHGRFDATTRRQLNERMGNAWANAGLGVRAAEAYLAATEGATSGHAIELYRRAAMHNLCSGHLSEGMDHLHNVLTRCGFRMARHPRLSLLRLALLRLRLRVRGMSFRMREPTQLSEEQLARADVCRTVAYGFGLYDFIRASEFHARALLLALDNGEPERVALALSLETVFEGCGGRRTRRRTMRLLSALERLVAGSSDELIEGWLFAARTSIAFAHGDFAKALELSDLTVDRIRPLPGVDYEVTTAALFGLWSLYYLGRWRELDERLDERVAEARQRGDLYTEANLRTGVLNAPWLLRDRPDAARTDLADAMRHWPARTFHLQHYWELLAECQTALYQDEPARAWQWIAGGWGRFQRSFFMRIAVVRAEAAHARARAELALAKREPDPRARRRLLRSVRSTARRLTRERVPWCAALGALLAASAVRLEGDEKRGAQALHDAAALCEACDMLGFANAARVRRASWLGVPADEAREALRAEGVVDPDRVARMLVP